MPAGGCGKVYQRQRQPVKYDAGMSLQSLLKQAGDAVKPDQIKTLKLHQRAKGIAMRYIVTGAGGHLGSTILRLLKNEKVEVIGLLHHEEEPAVDSPNIRYKAGDVRRPETLEPLFTESKEQDVVVIHTAGLISIAGHISPQLREVNVNGTANMLSLGKRYAVSRFIYVSSVHAIPELPVPQIIREVEQFSPELVSGGYAKTKAEASQLVLDAAARGFPAVVVHPSGIIGPYDAGHNHLTQLVMDYLRGKLPVCVNGGYDFVDVRDVARGCLLAAEKGRPGRCYILNGHYLSILELLTRAGRLAGKKPPCIIPMSLAKLAAPAVQAVAQFQHRRPLYTHYSLHTLNSNSVFSRERGESELGYRSRKIDETIRDMVQWLTGREAVKPI